MLLQDGRSDSYTENFVVEDSKEAADPQVVAIVYSWELRGINVLQHF